MWCRPIPATASVSSSPSVEGKKRNFFLYIIFFNLDLLFFNEIFNDHILWTPSLKGFETRPET